MESVRPKIKSIRSQNSEAENIGHGNVLQSRKALLEPQNFRQKKALGDLKNVFHLKNSETPKGGEFKRQNFLQTKSYSVTKAVTKKDGTKLKEKNPIAPRNEKTNTQSYSSGRNGFNYHEKWLEENILSFDELDEIFERCKTAEEREQNGEIEDYHFHVKEIGKRYQEMNSEIDKILNQTAKKREEISPFEDSLDFHHNTGNQSGAVGLYGISLPEDEELLKDLEFLGI